MLTISLQISLQLKAMNNGLKVSSCAWDYSTGPRNPVRRSLGRVAGNTPVVASPCRLLGRCSNWTKPGVATAGCNLRGEAIWHTRSRNRLSIARISKNHMRMREILASATA